MKALSIHQPYAHLIASGQKFIENRGWRAPRTSTGRWLVIHASKNTHCVPVCDRAKYGRALQFGRAVALAHLSACVHVSDLDGFLKQNPAFRWVRGNEHAAGPVLWILSHVYAFREAVPLRGQRGLFEVTDPDVTAAIGVSLAAEPYLMPFCKDSCP